LATLQAIGEIANEVGFTLSADTDEVRKRQAEIRKRADKSIRSPKGKTIDDFITSLAAEIRADRIPPIDGETFRDVELAFKIPIPPKFRR